MNVLDTIHVASKDEIYVTLFDDEHVGNHDSDGNTDDNDHNYERYGHNIAGI